MSNRDYHMDWVQGKLVKTSGTEKFTEADIASANRREGLYVRMSPMGNAICQTNNPDDAKWIAGRLNKAALLEKAFDELEHVMKSNVGQGAINLKIVRIDNILKLVKYYE